jgi:hypothetical protein
MPAQTDSLESNESSARAETHSWPLVERRSVPRIATPFPTTVRGVDQAGDRFIIDAVLDNFSAAGLYVRLVRPIELGARLFVVVRFVVTPVPRLPAPGVAARGVAVRVDRQSGGARGIAIKFVRQRFLYAAEAASA